MAKEGVFYLLLMPLSVSLPLGGGGLGLFGLIEMGVLTLFTLPAWRMLPARGRGWPFALITSTIIIITVFLLIEQSIISL